MSRRRMGQRRDTASGTPGMIPASTAVTATPIAGGLVEPVPSLRAGGWLRVDEVVELLEKIYGERNAVSPRAVQTWTRRAVNRLPSTLLGHRLLIHQNDLERWLAAGGRSRASAVATGRSARGPSRNEKDEAEQERDVLRGEDVTSR